MRPATTGDDLHDLFDTRDQQLWAEELERVDSAAARISLEQAGALLESLPEGDYLQVEEVLEDALLELEQARQLAAPVKRFFEVTLLQGLAFLRLRQGRRREALFIYLVMADSLERRLPASAPSSSRLLDRAERLAAALEPARPAAALAA